MNVKSIGVLTGGGDAPGMNAAVRAVVRGAMALGMRAHGIRRAYEGLVQGDICELGARAMSAASSSAAAPSSRPRASRISQSRKCSRPRWAS